MFRAVGLFLVLFAIWIALSGHFTPFLLVAGAVCCALVVFIAHRMDVIDHESFPVQMTGRLPLYWVWLSLEVVKAKLDVAWRVWHPRLPIDPALERLPASQHTDLSRVIYANSITLTPGTVSTYVGEGFVEVHALNRASLEALREGEMDRRATRLEPKS